MGHLGSYADFTFTFLGKGLPSHSTSLHPSVVMGASKPNAEG